MLHSILQRKGSTKSAKHTSALILVPTKELATQVTATLQAFTSFCSQVIRSENITRAEDDAVTKSRLAEVPDVVVATPSRAHLWVNNQVLKLQELKHLVIDEADLVLSYGYEEDLQSLASILPSGVQTIMMSATLRTETSTLTALFCKSGEPTILDLSAEEAAEKPTLSQYIVRTAEEDKFLLIYAIFKLQLIKGKVIVFVADVDRCYRVKLFLEQFGIRACVLNAELPVNSRLHTVDQFNKGLYDLIIAADEAEVVGEDTPRRKKRKAIPEEEEAGEDNDARHVEGGEEKDEDQPESTPVRAARGNNKEFGVSRGIDFRRVSCVLNFDLPTTAKSYTHRVGRTARGGQMGMALSFYVPKELYRKHKPTTILQCANDEAVLNKIKTRQEERGAKIEEWTFDMAKLEAFRYRFTDALRSVTRIAVREARTRELKHELINSEKLKRHFEENPEDLRHLRHDRESHAVRQQAHLRHVPDYLLPEGGKRAMEKDVGFVGIRKDEVHGKGKKGGRMGKGRTAMRKGKGMDPLKSLNMRGRGKK